jgi:hypothetical protein
MSSKASACAALPSLQLDAIHRLHDQPDEGVSSGEVALSSENSFAIDLLSIGPDSKNSNTSSLMRSHLSQNGARRFRANSAYGKRLSMFVGVRSRPPRASFLDPAFTVHRRCWLFFASVAVRFAVQASAVEQRVLHGGKEHYPFPTIPCLIRGSSSHKSLIHVRSVQSAFQ